MAIACLRLFTLPPLPPLPLFSLPFLRRRIALSTSFEALREYFLAMLSSLARVEKDFRFFQAASWRDRSAQGRGGRSASRGRGNPSFFRAGSTSRGRPCACTPP